MVLMGKWVEPLLGYTFMNSSTPFEKQLTLNIFINEYCTDKRIVLIRYVTKQINKCVRLHLF